MVLAAIFRIKNNVFMEQLRIVIQEDKTTQNILKKISLRDIKEFIIKERFLLFQEKIYVPTKLRKKVIAE